MKSLRVRLIAWYIGSLLVFTLFFWFVIHIFALPYGTEYFIVLFLVLAGIGFYIIYKMTRSITYLTGRIRHISRKNLDERIVEIDSEDEIGELAKSFNNLLNDLNDAFKREQQFIADVAHELKTPLATQRSSLEVMLSKERTKDEYRKALVSALDENNHISSMLKNVLDLAWSETYDDKKNSSVFNLSELIEEISDIAEKISQSRNLQVNSFIQNKLFINGFRDKLARAIINIVDNAVKYTHKGKIVIKLRKNNNKAILTIADTGQGIEIDESSKIFTRFYRGSKTDKIPGSGLGLAISKSVITLHGGDIDMKSIPDKGTTFYISLPLIK